MVKASGWQSFDRQFDPYLRAFVAAPLRCGLGCSSRTDGRIHRFRCLYANTCIHAHAYIVSHTYTCTCTHIHAHILIHTHTCTYMHTCKYTQIQILIYTHICMYWYVYICIGMYMHVWTLKLYVCVCMNMYVYVCACISFLLSA